MRDGPDRDGEQRDSERRDGGDGEAPPFFGGLPTRGVWTALGLTRAQFLAILSLSVATFLFLDGPLWEHYQDNHFRRIVVSYLSIPAMIVATQVWRRRFHMAVLVGGSIVIGVIKLLLTALIVLMLSF